MKIQSIETFTQGVSQTVVRVRTDDGAEGVGQTAPGNADVTATVLHRQIAPLALGADAADIDALVDRCTEGTYKFPGSYCRRALSGLDTALWDLRGKLEGKSVCELLGGRPRAIPAYASSTSRTIRPDQEAERLTALRDSHGFGAFKIKIGKRCGHDEDEWSGRTESIVSTVRDALGAEAVLFVDANSCYTPARAIEVARVLEANHVALFEEPCPWWEVDWTAQVTRAVDVPVGGGEQDFWMPIWRRIIGLPAVDIVQPDVCYVGGMTRALRVAAMADEANLPCMPHSPSRSMVSVFTQHLVGAIPNARGFIEASIESGAPMKDYFDPAVTVCDGTVRIPDGPGWGVTVRPDWLAAAHREVSTSD